jgi:PIN domain nuclease of toxin-antitoxin system
MATCWEIAIKVGLKKLDLGEPATTFLPRELATNHFDLLGIELAHATFVELLPPHHKDPFDRLLVAQAVIEKLTAGQRQRQFRSVRRNPFMDTSPCEWHFLKEECVRGRGDRRGTPWW